MSVFDKYKPIPANSVFAKYKPISSDGPQEQTQTMPQPQQSQFSENNPFAKVANFFTSVGSNYSGNSDEEVKQMADSGDSESQREYMARKMNPLHEIGQVAKNTFEGVKSGLAKAREGTDALVDAINPSYPSSSPDKGTDLGNRIVKGAGGVFDTINGGLQTFFSPASAVIHEVPIAEKVIGYGMDKLNQGSQFAADKVKSGLNIDSESEQGKALDKGFNVLGQLGALKFGEDAKNFKAREAGMAEALKAGDIAKYEKLAGSKVSIGENFAGNLTKGVDALAQKGTKAMGDLVKKSGVLATDAVPKIREARAQRVIDSRVKELTKLQENNAVIRRAIESADKKGVDIKTDLAKTDLLKGAVDSDGTIRTQPAIDQLNEFIRPQEDVIGENLRKEGKTLPLSDVEVMLKTAVKDSGVKGGALVRALRNVEADIEGYKLEATPEGNIPVATLHDAKVDKYSNIDYLNPETSKIDKTIAKSLKKIVEDNTSSIDVKKLNTELSRHYSMQNLLEKLNGKKVAGGRLGKYFAQTIGGIVGSHFGPLGAIAGAEVGNILKGAQMKGKLGGTTGFELTSSDAMKSAIDSAKN